MADLKNVSASAHPGSLSGGGTNDVILSLGANVTSADFMDVVADGVTNPPSGTYQISLGGDVVVALAPRSTPPVPPRPVPHPQPVWPRFLTTGTLVMTPHHSYVVLGHTVRPLLGARVLVATAPAPITGWLLAGVIESNSTSATAKRVVELRISERQWYPLRPAGFTGSRSSAGLLADLSQ